jgi:acyl-CoA synthetase (AMP-forming)/AMP-acid ligase II
MTRVSESQDFAAAFDQAVFAHGDRLAFRYADRSLTYAQLRAVVNEKRAAYASAGIRSSSTVGVIADDPAEFLSDVFALLKLQAFCVLLPAETTQWELERLSGKLRFGQILSATAVDGRSVPVGRARVLTHSDSEHTSIAHPSCLGFLTSGTTGGSKIALRTVKAMLVEAAAMRHELGLTPGRRLGAMVPLHHSFGFGDCALAGILAGVELSSYPRMHPSAYLAAFERSSIEVVALVPSQLRLLAEACNAPVFGRLSAMSGGAPLDAGTARLAKERLGCALGQVYGSTETGIMTVAPPGEGGNGCVGKPSRHMEMRLDGFPPEWHSEAAAADAEGVVAVRSQALFEGYVTSDGVDRRPVETGWFSTGDCARWVDGRLELLGRLSSAINVGGVKVSAEEVEAALLEFPGVRTVLVTGVDDALRHQRIKACVTPADVDVEALRRFCEERLSPSKRPHYYEALAALATTPSGKVLRAAHGKP